MDRLSETNSLVILAGCHADVQRCLAAYRKSTEQGIDGADGPQVAAIIASLEGAVRGLTMAVAQVAGLHWPTPVEMNDEVST
jgi:hypothetical protein